MQLQQSGGCQYLTKLYSKSSQAYLDKKRAERNRFTLSEGTDYSESTSKNSEGKTEKIILERNPKNGTNVQVIDQE
jgi:hypothetical protein